MSKSNKNQYTNTAKIIGIQFGILSPEEIRNSSVAEITSKDTYVNNKPVIGGIFDPRMGVGDPGLICPTDGHDYMQCPGYFGHIELAKPVFYIQYLNTVLKILRCICFKCSKLLVNKEKYKHVLEMNNEHRWKFIFALASKVKRCGENTDDGCGCLQASKIRKEGLATIFAEWIDTNKEALTVKLTPEMILKLFKRISDEDVHFMGFSPTWSRPDWMICQVLGVPPPSIRPSVKVDHQQRSEDDLTHILVNILKTNKILHDKIANNSPENVIQDWESVLQYYIATQIDNKIPGVLSIAQRSGRPLKSIKDRLNGKSGRMRANLMAKRVDFSARSVITADPNISIRELGIPLKIAKNITKPIVVNDRNKDFLYMLVKNGPDIYPGAKIWEKKNGESVTLRYVDKESIVLENGDTVHRHMMDGDAILFNRQPTLHRMSMMCHIAKIMKRGDTFRMNVADTKPYNADFDGDEMNLHMPQDVECDAELKNLAAVPYQIISPGSNSPIIGIYQDSMVGAYLFTQEKIVFTQRQAMNLLMMFDRINIKELMKKKEITNFDILSQILPPMTLKIKNGSFGEEDAKTSNNIIEIRNGLYIRGQMDKGTLNSSKGLINRTCNDFGNMASSNFIDNLQNIITSYLKSTAFSVGISDLYSDAVTKEKISKVISDKNIDVKTLIEETQLGVFENTSGKTNLEEFETKVNNILNQATSETGKIGMKSLSKGNRFVTMFKAGSKGSELNISQMISCIGQQNVDGKRIPYGFEDRTLPHFTKFDDTPKARGFIESSYINGLSPTELFFHAMGGRVGLIDTAVKTSTTGYIQRRLVKGMEDLMANYDITVRSSKGKIIQFVYGEDGIDPIRVENQTLKLVQMSIREIYEYYTIPTKNDILKSIFVIETFREMVREEDRLKIETANLIKKMLEFRLMIGKYVFLNKDESVVRSPVSFTHIIENIVGQQNLNINSVVDITPIELIKLLEDTYNKLRLLYYNKPTDVFEALYYFFLSPKELLINKRFNKVSIILLLEMVVLQYKRAMISPGEMVGLIAAQSIGEPVTQMTLNTFHFAGVSAKSNVSRGVPRLEEILSLSSEPKNSLLSIYLKPEDETNKEKATWCMYMLEYTKLEELVKDVGIYFDPYDTEDTLIKEDAELLTTYKHYEEMIAECAETKREDVVLDDRSKWVLRMVLDSDIMLEKGITMDDIHFTLSSIYGNEISCMFSDYNSDKLVFRIRMENIVSKSVKTQKKKSLDQSDNIFILKTFQDNLLKNVVLRGVKGIKKIILRKIKDNMVYQNDAFEKKEIWVLDGVGSNLSDVLALDFIDPTRTISNNIMGIYDIFGIEATRQVIYNELMEVIEFDGTYINYHHLSVLIDRMCHSYKPISIFRHGINNDAIGPIAKASFEETPEMFLKAARHGELDILRGVSANVMCGQEGLYGTNCFQVVLDMEKMRELDAQNIVHSNIEKEIEEMNDGFKHNECDNLISNNDISTIKIKEVGQFVEKYNAGF